MKVLYVTFSDLGQVCKSRCDALNQCTQHSGTCISINGHTDIDFLKDCPTDDKGEINLKVAVSAMSQTLCEIKDDYDVIHQANTHPDIFGAHKYDNFVCEFNGGYMRMYSKMIWMWQAASKTPIICPPILGRFCLRFHYVPVPLATDALVPREDWLEERSPIVVMQTATRRDYKDTDALIEVCKGLDGVDLKIYERVPKEESLRVKRDGDVYFESFMFGGIGMSPREAMSCGQVAITRLQPIERLYNPHFAGINCSNPKELREAIVSLASDWSMLAQKKQECRDYAVWRYSYPIVAKQQVAFYEHVMHDDDPYWWEQESKIWMETARKEHGLNDFVNPQLLRW